MGNEELKELSAINIVGLMGMATNTTNRDQISKEFGELNTFFIALKEQYSSLKTLSMGMSADYEIAIKEGANMIRVGSSIFGERNY